VRQSLELAELRSRAEAAARRVGLARWHSVLPGLGAGVSAEREEGSWSVGPAVNLAIPLFDWGQGERGRAWAELRQVRELYRERALAVRAGARAAAQRLVGSRERADHLRTVLVPLRRRIVDATLLQYNAMQASPFELIQARQAEIDAEVRLVEALREAHLAAGDVDRLRAGGAGEP
jgi:outer membrane protein TolC